MSLGIFNKFYEALYSRGYVSAKKWTHLGMEDSGAKKKREFSNYLDFDHPGRKLFVELVKSRKPGSVLEIGSGGMHELRALSQEGVTKDFLKYTVMDIAKKFLTEGEKEFPELDTIVGSVNKAVEDNGKEKFDWVYCRHLIEHQPYYEVPIKNMFDRSKEIVMINCFRWTFGNDIINPKPYFSNHYNVFKLMSYVSNLFEKVETYIILKDEKYGQRHRKEKDPLTQRTSDHLFFVCYKNKETPSLSIEEVADQHGVNLVSSPYSEVIKRIQ